MSYVVGPRGVDRCRLVAGIDVSAPSSVLGNVLLTLLAFGDLSMMREQLLTLKRCAERTARARARR